MSVGLVVIDPGANSSAAVADAGSEPRWSTLCVEMLDHLRLDHQLVSAVPAEFADAAVVLLLSPASLDPADVLPLESWSRAGGTLIVVGGTGGLAELAELAGVRDGDPVDSGHLRVDPLWWWVPRFAVVLPAFGGRRLQPADDDVTVLGRWHDGAAGIVSRQIGAGKIVVFGADPWQSIGRIQQGWPVDGPGTPASDGSAAIGADGIRRVDDGLALSLEADRATPGRADNKASNPPVHPPTDPVPIFQHAYADLWRELMFHLIADAADEHDVPLGWLHYWPAGIPAVGHLSHDADQNIDDHAAVALQAFQDAGVSVTWCQCWPGGYSTATLAAITAAGHEQALHYNALDSYDGMPWGLDSLRQQYDWATQTTGATIVSNKNHYTRWEGWTEFYGWCEQVGIQIDESRGPSKSGTVGFPYGTSHVGFPIDEAGRRYDVLALPLHSQDLGWAAHEAAGPAILDQALTHHGVAHVVFHGTNLNRSANIVGSVGRLTRAGRQRGMQWWTAGQINSFERARRGVSVRVDHDESAAAGLLVTVTATVELPAAGIVVAPSSVASLTQSRWLATDAATGQVLPTAVVSRHGREFLEITADLPVGSTEIRLTATSNADLLATAGATR